MHYETIAADPFSFFFKDPATTEIYTLSLHDALPISRGACAAGRTTARSCAPPSASCPGMRRWAARRSALLRSEEHTSELQSRGHLVCRLLLEKKNKNEQANTTSLDKRRINFDEYTWT